MSLQAKILTLLAGVNDPTLRLDVATTINYLLNVYISGNADEKEIYTSIYEVCKDVLTVKHPDLTSEEIEKIAKDFTNDFIALFRIQRVTRRSIIRFGRRMLF